MTTEKQNGLTPTSDPALASASGSVLARLNESVKYFDFEAWKEQDSSCLLCHAPMSLDFGCEWPDDPRLLLCWGCMSQLCAELIAKLEAPNDQAERQPPGCARVGTKTI